MLVTERTALAAELQAVMAARGATEWAKVLDVDRTTVHKWWAGDAYPRGRQLEAIARETRRHIRFVEQEHEEAAPPDWAERLERRLDVLVSRAGVDPSSLDEDETTRLVREALARASSPQRNGGGV